MRRLLYSIWRVVATALIAAFATSACCIAVLGLLALFIDRADPALAFSVIIAVYFVAMIFPLWVCGLIWSPVLLLAARRGGDFVKLLAIVFAPLSVLVPLGLVGIFRPGLDDIADVFRNKLVTPFIVFLMLEAAFFLYFDKVWTRREAKLGVISPAHEDAID